MKYTITLPGGHNVNVILPNAIACGESFEVEIDGRTVACIVESERDGRVRLRVDGTRHEITLEGAEERDDGPGRRVRLAVRNRVYQVTAEKELDRLRALPARGKAGPVTLHAALPGVIRQVFVEPGALVAEGDAVLTLEAMKMENEVSAEISGVVEEIFVTPGETVAARAALARIVPRAAAPTDES